MSFKRCEDLEDVLSKLSGYERMIDYSSNSRADPFNSDACATVELMDMVKVLTREVDSLKSELLKVKGAK